MPASAPLRVLVAGCGLVTERHHLPALAALVDDVAVVALVDPDAARRDVCRTLAPAATPYADLATALAAEHPDEVVVASPASLHRDQTLAAFDAGAHVLCEKPLAVTSADCAAMIDAAEAAGKVLGVGLMRRFLPSVQAIASLLRDGVLGAPRSFTVLEGVAFSWPVTSDHPFRRGSGGGVIFDAGPHLLDILQQWFGELELVDYADDAMGGVEANCLLTLAAAGGVTGTVRMSRDVLLPNRHVIECERGWVAYHYDVADRFYWGWHGAPTANTVHLATPPSDRPMWDFPDPRHRVSAQLATAFVAQHRNIVAAIRGEAELVVKPDEAAAGIALLERAHATRRLLDMGWLDEAEQARAAALEVGA